ncbi:MAG TPA: M4 family metallopeptidase, partial [Thermoleophilia bacterium]|nr:M4 family metallopeptidase [Thermoleophilia bacterium]
NNRRSGVSAARNFSKVYDTLRNCLHRNSVNNKGLSLIGNIHLGVDYENAFWSQGARMMFFGDNAKGQAPFAKSLDVIGHEVGHGVTQYATQSGLDYEDQSGAINESISDIWGATCDYNDWTIGEGLAKKPIRSLRQPSLYGQPEDMLDYTMLPDTSVTDMGGVHIDSGIGNLFFYRLSTDPRTPITPPAKDGRWTAARVVYGSYEYLAGKPRATYADWALALHAAAVTVDAQYSAGGALVAATDQALASVHMSAEIAAYDDGNVFNAQGNLVPPLKFGLGLAGKLAYVGVKVTTPGSMKLATMCIGLLDLGQHATTGDYQVVVLPVAADGGPDMSALSSPLDAELVDVNSAAATRNDGTFMNVKVTGADKVTPEPRSMGGEFFVMIGYVDSPGDATQYGSLMLDDGLGSTGRTWVASQAGSGWVTQSLSGHNALIRAIFTD